MIRIFGAITSLKQSVVEYCSLQRLKPNRISWLGWGWAREPLDRIPLLGWFRETWLCLLCGNPAVQVSAGYCDRYCGMRDYVRVCQSLSPEYVTGQPQAVSCIIDVPPQSQPLKDNLTRRDPCMLVGCRAAPRDWQPCLECGQPHCVSVGSCPSGMKLAAARLLVCWGLAGLSSFPHLFDPKLPELLGFHVRMR